MVSHPTISILIIDDNAEDRLILSDLLSVHKHSIITASSGIEGLRVAREVVPDLIILDVMMPGMDGFTVCTQLRADPITAEVPIIMATALDDRQSRLRCLAVGADEFLTKPLDTAELRVRVEAIARVNRYRRLLDERARAEREILSRNAELEQRVAARTAELIEANDRLQELNRFKDNLLATASHDLRSPLTAILSIADLLLEEQLPPDEVRSFTQNISTAAHLLNAMLSNVLDLTRLEAGDTIFDPSELYLSNVVRRALDALGTSAQSKSIEIQLLVEPEEPCLIADPVKLSRVVINLVSNAIKFTPRNGKITISVQPEPNGACLRVADTGLGIPAESIPRLFDKFHQIHTRGTAGEGGTGLGLAIVRQLVELHGGVVEVESEVQRGSTFSVRLPLQRAAIGEGSRS